MTVANWSTTAALNVLDSGVSGSGGTISLDGTVMKPSEVDNAFRSIMAQVASFNTAAAFGDATLTSTDAGATAGPTLTLYRNSATPAASDIVGRILFQGEDSAGNTEDYAEDYVTIADTTSTSEDASRLFRIKVAGTMTTVGTASATGWAFVGSLSASGNLALTAADDGAAAGPTITLTRNSASPAISDLIGYQSWVGKDSGGNNTTYADMFATIADPTDGSEDANINIRSVVAGTITNQITINSLGSNFLAIGASSPSTGAFTTLSATSFTPALTLTAGQIVFPASQNASAGANTLDDYEEGTFTPSMTFNGSATGVLGAGNAGRYTKIGDRVFFEIVIALTSNGSGVGTALVTGLPFAAAAGSSAACAVQAISGFSGLTAGVSANVVGGTTTIALRGPSTTGSAALTDTNVTDSATFNISGHYSV
jgi:hypothetical protein